MIHAQLPTLVLALCLAIACTAASAQENLREQLFGETDKVLNEAREKRANLYGPTSFATAMEYYRDAEDEFKRGKNIEDIRGKLKNAMTFLQKAIEACKLGEVTFSSNMAARADAISADAPRYSSENWRRAEARFKSAAEELEDGDVKDAQQQSGEAEALYRSAELEAIQANYLTPARDLIAKADDMDVKDSAPKTLDKAKKLSTQAEVMLKENRYDTDEARQVAQQAKYEAAHAIYLHETITKLKKEDTGYEDVMLAPEEPFRRIANALDVHVEFDRGIDLPAQELIAAINAWEKKSSLLTETVQRQEREIANLKEQVASMEGRLGSLTETEKDLQRQLEHQRKQEETIAEVTGMFNPQEGNVLRDGNNIVIRLYGLTFPVGTNIIQPQFFGLLTKVQDAIRKFPGCQAAIEGHTDSQGSDETNQRLSESRAEAVAQYLKANMGSGVPIASQGYGESRPVASNDTFEGRAKNRRIDVVIIPKTAIVGR